MAARSASSRTSRAKPKGRSRPARSRPRLPRPGPLGPHARDGLGLAGVAAALLLGVVLYAGGDGGRLGSALAGALRELVGLGAYAVPPAVLLGSVALLGGAGPPVAARAARTGTVVLFLALCLGLAAGTLGLGPGVAAGDAWESASLQARGGAVGEALRWASEGLLSRVGTHLAVLALGLIGILLVSGETVAGVLGAVLRAVAAVLARGRAWLAERRAVSGVGPHALAGARRARERGEEADPEAVTGVGAFAPAPEALEPEPGVPEGPDLDATHEPEPDAVVEPEPEPQLEAEPEPELDAEPDPELEPAPRPPADPAQLTPQGRYRASVTDAEDFPWQLPTPRVLTRSSRDSIRPDTGAQERTAAALLEALGHFGVQAKVIGTVAGPHITRYELRLAPGTKVGKVANLKDDLAYALASETVRILAPIPGKQAVGVELPNAQRRIVHLGDVFGEAPGDWSPLTVWLGKDVGGRAVGTDLAKMPHLLVAGTTGAGKSGAINAMLSSVLLRATPREVRMVLVDPKQVELNHYDSIPHLLTPVITSPRMAANALANLVREMEERYGMMSLARTRSLPELNRARAERGQAALPYVLCVIDELADLMMVAPADVEDAIIRLAQKARAVGIHLVLATQSPRVDVITGMIKANVPSRIAFAVSSQTDSRVILDQNGAESLLGQGDMLFSPVGTSRLQRIQGAFIDEGQIAAITGWWRRQGEPDLQEQLLEAVEEPDAPEEADDDAFDPDEDPLLEDAIRLVAEMGTASTSMLQRRLRLGYTRAGRLIDMLERRGVISGYEGSKPRQVLVAQGDVPRVVAALRDTAGSRAAAGGRGGRAAAPAALADEPGAPPDGLV